MTHHLQVLTKGLPNRFLRETLDKPWMRLFIFVDDGPLTRTPEHYKKFLYDWRVKTPTPVHYIPEPNRWKKTEDGQIIPVQNIALPLKYPRELHEGIWGGDAVIKGFEKRDKRKRRVAHYWVPHLQETVVYSEILNKYIKTVVTERALDLIDEHYGLDNYLLKSSPCDIASEFALKLKKEMLYALLHKTLYPDDEVKREQIYNKYKEFIIPEEELEWFGLTIREAYRKQMKLEEAAQNIGPYKHIFRKEFIEHLQNNPEFLEEQDESTTTSILERVKSLNIFSKSK